MYMSRYVNEKSEVRTSAHELTSMGNDAVERLAGNVGGNVTEPPLPDAVQDELVVKRAKRKRNDKLLDGNKLFVSKLDDEY